MIFRRNAIFSLALLAVLCGRLPAPALLASGTAPAGTPLLKIPALPLPKSASLPEFSADHVRTDRATGDIISTGNARLSRGIALLTADEIRYNPKTQTATATGHVEFTRGPLRVLADAFFYKVATGEFTVIAPRLGEYPYYIFGKEASGVAKNDTPPSVTLTDATVTYQEPGLFAPTLRAGTLTYTQVSGAPAHVKTDDTRLGLGPLSLFKLPRLSGAVDRSLLSDFTGRVGFGGDLGEFIDVGAAFPVGDGVKLGGDVGVYLIRGLMVGPKGGYDITTGNGGRITGSFESGYIHDYGDRSTDILGRPIGFDRGFVTWKHDQFVTPDLHLFGQLNYWSDSDIIRDFRSDQFYDVQQPDNFFEADYVRPGYVISVFTRYQLNAYYPVQQRLPEIRFDLLPASIGQQGIYQKGSFSFASLTSNDPEAPGAPFTPMINTNRVDAYYGLYRPVAYKDVATITPIVGGRATYYANATGGDSTYSRVLGEIGFDAETHFEGTFNYQNEKWGIDGLRHIMTPRLSYRYIPQADKGTPYIPPIDDQTFTTYLQPLGLGDIRDIDRIPRTDTFRVGLDNTLQTRDKNYGSRDLLVLNFAADFRLANAIPAGGHAFSAVYSTLAVMPARWLTFNLFDSVIPQHFTLNELNTGFQIHDSQLWSVEVATHYLRNQINEYVAEGRYRLNELYDVFARVDYDSGEHRFNQRSIGLIQRLGHNLWTIRYSINMYEGASRNNGFSANMQLNLAGF